MRDACSYADLICRLDRRLPLFRRLLWQPLWRIALRHALKHEDD